MANICKFKMKVIGEDLRDIKIFLAALKGEYSPSVGGYIEIEKETYSIDRKTAIFEGWCKWSVAEGMCTIIPEEDFITLQEACEKWKLICEVYSKEPGNKLQEHYICDKGNVIKNERTEYNCVTFGGHAIKEKAEEYLGCKISDEDWNRRIIEKGGFEWVFEIV